MKFSEFNAATLQVKAEFISKIIDGPCPPVAVILYEKYFIEIICSLYGSMISAEACMVPEECLEEVKRLLGGKEVVGIDATIFPEIKKLLVRKIMSAAGQNN